MKLAEALEIEWNDLENLSQEEYVQLLPDYKGGELEIHLKGHRYGLNEVALGMIVATYHRLSKISKERGCKEMKLHFYSESSNDEGLPERVRLGFMGLIDFECNPIHKAPIRSMPRREPLIYREPPRPKPGKIIGDTAYLDWAHLERISMKEIVDDYFPDYKGGEARLSLKGKREDTDSAIAIGQLIALYSELKRRGNDVKLIVESSELGDRGLPARIKSSMLTGLIDFNYKPQ